MLSPGTMHIKLLKLIETHIKLTLKHHGAAITLMMTCDCINDKKNTVTLISITQEPPRAISEFTKRFHLNFFSSTHNFNFKFPIALTMSDDGS